MGVEFQGPSNINGQKVLSGCPVSERKRRLLFSLEARWQHLMIYINIVPCSTNSALYMKVTHSAKDYFESGMVVLYMYL